MVAGRDRGKPDPDQWSHFRCAATGTRTSPAHRVGPDDHSVGIDRLCTERDLRCRITARRRWHRIDHDARGGLVSGQSDQSSLSWQAKRGDCLRGSQWLAGNRHRSAPNCRPATQVALPLLGMILGNALTGISLGLDRFVSSIQQRRVEIEGCLMLGATRWEAVAPIAVDAVRTGMIPILNTMSIAGIVSLPGMMTGQLLAGVAPLDAVRYQIVIMFLIAAAVAIGTVGAVLISFSKITTPSHQVMWLDNEQS